MTSSAAQRFALIAQVANDYKKVFGHPPGKKALQKLVYILQRRAKDAKNYGFSFYNYGVFSHDLARDISDAERYDFLDIKYDEANNAYEIVPSPFFADNRHFSPNFYNEGILADVLSRSAKDLELITTIMFVCDEEHIADKEEIVKRVRELKPKFSEGEVRQNIRSEFCSCA